MKVALRKSSNLPLQRRELMLVQRTRTPALRVVYPDVGHLRIELVFSDPSANTPSPQFHTLFPAAPAFFRFACPCADCDGDFDLTVAVKTALESPNWRKQGAVSTSDVLPCRGTRLHQKSEDKSCSMQLRFKLLAAPRSVA
jgi:hypothetical protein